MKAMIKTMTLLAAITLVAASIGSPAFAADASGSAAKSDSKTMTVRTGYLTCHVSAGWGFIFGSSRDIKCAYALQPGYTEYYTGSISKFGADIGYLQSAVLLWSVAAPTNNLGQGALAGHYAGATASLALGVGAGANVLVGGFKNSIALQPISVEGQNGLNVAAGVAELTLKFDKAKKAKSD
ncbi:MAG TPA: DUF992 domain-containing protein [Candidatus Binataceae bacterium]|nr:DUF992 domain-containing protein [Candidatus Binataceae bacterium]